MELNRDDHPFIADLEVGDAFDSFFVVHSMQMNLTRANKAFLVFEFTDRTGRIKGKLWDDAEEVYQAVGEGIVVKVRAVVEEYRGNAELKIIKIRTTDDEDPGDLSRFVPTSDRDPSVDWEAIHSAVDQIEHPGLAKLFEQLFADEEFVERFQTSPAGKRWHHGYIGGLLEHVASMTTLAVQLTEHYPQLNRDLLISGAVLHDIGKLQELRSDTTIDYTVEGRLLGHIVLGVQFVDGVAKQIEELDKETRVQLLHLILSHQGTRENSSPVEPMTREAFALYYLDELDAKLNALGRELAKLSAGPFTEHIRLLNRMLYKGGGLTEPGTSDTEGQ